MAAVQQAITQTVNKAMAELHDKLVRADILDSQSSVSAFKQDRSLGNGSEHSRQVAQKQQGSGFPGPAAPGACKYAGTVAGAATGIS